MSSRRARYHALGPRNELLPRHEIEVLARGALSQAKHIDQRYFEERQRCDSAVANTKVAVDPTISGQDYDQNGRWKRVRELGASKPFRESSFHSQQSHPCLWWGTLRQLHQTQVCWAD